MDNIAHRNGALGEEYAAKALQKIGYKIEERNYHSKYGEIDIIASNSEYLLFVEVKTRSMKSWGLPREAVNYSKQQKIIKTAYSYIAEFGMNAQPRFDVVEVYMNSKTDDKPAKIIHIKGAFELSGCEDYSLF